RGGRKCREKLPNPRISMRPPWASASLMISRICLTANSTSLAGRCFCLAAMSSMSSDLVMSGPFLFFHSDRGRHARGDQGGGGRSPPPPKLWLLRSIGVLASDVLLEKIAKTRPAGGLAGAIALHRFGFLVDLLRLDRQRDRAALAIDVRELRFHFVVDLQHG